LVAPDTALHREVSSPFACRACGETVARRGPGRFHANRDRMPGFAHWTELAMNSPAPSQLQALIDRVERLARLTSRLLDENRSLRTSQQQLVAERAALLDKNEQARSRVEAMIQRLKSLEHNA